MFYIIDKRNNSTPIKPGFKTAAKANSYARKHLPRGEVRLWGEETDSWKTIRYYVTWRY